MATHFPPQHRGCKTRARDNPVEDAQGSHISGGDPSAFQEGPLVKSILVDLLAAATEQGRLFCAMSSNEGSRSHVEAALG